MSAPPLDSLGDNTSRSYGQPGASKRPASAQLRARAAGSSSQPVLRTKLPDEHEHEHEHEQADWPRRTKKPVPLCSLAPPWWVMPPEAVQAARKFDVGLVALSGRVERSGRPKDGAAAKGRRGPSHVAETPQPQRAAAEKAMASLQETPHADARAGASRSPLQPSERQGRAARAAAVIVQESPVQSRSQRPRDAGVHEQWC